MKHVSAVALFCEDIREEKSGQDTLVGIFSDNLVLPGFQHASGATALIPRLAVYIRINLDPEDFPKDISVRLIDPTGNIVAQSGWEHSVLEKAFADAQTHKLPVVGLLVKVVASPFAVTSLGKVVAMTTVNGVDYIAGAVNLNAPPTSKA